MSISIVATKAKSSIQALAPIGKLLVVGLVMLLTGCGSVEWFPKYERLPTTPDFFTFTSKSGVPVSSSVTSDPITVAGLTADSSPISVSGPAGSASKYAINNLAATDQPGSVKNGDKVTVTHTSSANLGTSTTSTLVIGNVSATFTGTTQLVKIPVFPGRTVAAGVLAESTGVTLVSADGIPGTHVISIKDSTNSGNAAYSLEDNANFTPFGQTISNLNGKVIFLRNRAAATSGATVTTTLTIDGVSADFVLTTQ
jgi:hypothetical protein